MRGLICRNILLQWSALHRRRGATWILLLENGLSLRSGIEGYVEITPSLSGRAPKLI